VLFFCNFFFVIIVKLIKGGMLMFNYKMLMIILLIFVTFNLSNKVYSAPPPSEVEEIKTRAPVHLIAVVKEDRLVKDLSKEKGTYFQIRKMILKVKTFIKNTPDLPNEIEVYYSYIPSWQENLWVGGKRIDIAVHDEIEIWLEEGDYGLEPALGGNTIHHIKYQANRNEPIKEPKIHKIQTVLKDIWSHHSSMFVFASFLLILIGILLSSIYLKKDN
jgi:hypothetical protein